MKVLVVGAGPTGLTAALELARQGIATDIVEKRTEPSELSRAVGIMPLTIDNLRPSGVGDALVKESMSLTKIKVYRNSENLMSLDFETLPRQPASHMWGLPQNRTESLMAEALERFGVCVSYGCELTGLEVDGE